MVSYYDKYGNWLPAYTPSQAPSRADDVELMLHDWDWTEYEIVHPDPSRPEITYQVNQRTGEVKLVAGDLNAPVPTGGGGGGGWGGGWGGGSAAPSATVRGWFQWYYGYTPADLIAKADRENWTEQDVINRALADGATGPGLDLLKSRMRQVAAPFYAGDPGGVPESLVISLLQKGYWDSAGVDYLQNTYFPSIRDTNATNPLATPFVDDWVQMTGRPLTTTALQKLNEIVRTYGYTDVARAAWQNWVKTTDSALSGNWGAEHRIEIYNDITSILGRYPTKDELDPNSALWNMNDAARLEYVRSSPEYKSIYEGKPPWMSEADFVSYAMAFDQVFRWYYGDAVTLNPDGSLTIPYGPYEQPTMTTVQTPLVADLSWKSLSAAQFRSDLQGLGFTVEGTGTDATQWTYKIGGQQVPYSALAGRLNELAPDTYYQDPQGFHYVQYEGALNPKTGQPAGVTRPASQMAETQVETLGLAAWTGGYVNSQMVADLIAANVTPEELRQMFVWTEEAAYLEGVYGETVTEAFGGAAGIDWYTMASGAQGSGAMRAQLVQAQNRVAFREVYRDYYGTDPSPADYDYLTSNFVSPTEFAHRMAAKESAKANFDKVNELLTRTLDAQVTLADLENLAMGGYGSGELQAMIDEATRLDAFTDVLYQWVGHKPTADDYAQVAGFPSAASFKWEITVSEKVKEMGPEIMSTWVKAYPDNPLSEEQLRIMIGQSEGWGDLQRMYNEALEEEEKQEITHKVVPELEKIRSIYTIAQQGGFREALPGLSDIGEVQGIKTA